MVPGYSCYKQHLPADVRNFLTAVNENANNLDHHSLFRKIENLQRIDDSNESNSNLLLFIFD